MSSRPRRECSATPTGPVGELAPLRQPRPYTFPMSTVSGVTLPSTFVAYCSPVLCSGGRLSSVSCCGAGPIVYSGRPSWVRRVQMLPSCELSHVRVTLFHVAARSHSGVMAECRHRAWCIHACR